MEPATIQLNRLYNDLAWLWPLMSPPEEYADEAELWRIVLREKLGQGRHEILELGVGGGHNLSHLVDGFSATAVDASENMLAHSMRLNPRVKHLVGDMRTIRLGRTFAAVLIHDAISHMLTQDDLAAAFATAAAHLEPGGILITTPDHYRETFSSPQVECVTHTRGDTQLTYTHYAHAPGPDDTSVENIIVYFIREQGRLRIEHDRLITGLFPRETWARLMAGAGFAFEELSYRLKGSGNCHPMLVGTLQQPG